MVYKLYLKNLFLKKNKKSARWLNRRSPVVFLFVAATHGQTCLCGSSCIEVGDCETLSLSEAGENHLEKQDCTKSLTLVPATEIEIALCP